jgi:hypothetical protein
MPYPKTKGRQNLFPDKKGQECVFEDTKDGNINFGLK